MIMLLHFIHKSGHRFATMPPLNEMACFIVQNCRLKLFNPIATYQKSIQRIVNAFPVRIISGCVFLKFLKIQFGESQDIGPSK